MRRGRPGAASRSVLNPATSTFEQPIPAVLARCRRPHRRKEPGPTSGPSLLPAAQTPFLNDAWGPFTGRPRRGHRPAWDALRGGWRAGRCAPASQPLPSTRHGPHAPSTRHRRHRPSPGPPVGFKRHDESHPDDGATILDASAAVAAIGLRGPIRRRLNDAVHAGSDRAHPALRCPSSQPGATEGASQPRHGSDSARARDRARSAA